MLVELCKEDDKNVTLIVKTSLSQGYEVMLGQLYPKNKALYYYVDIMNHRPITSEEYKAVASGVYSLTNGVFVSDTGN